MLGLQDFFVKLVSLYNCYIDNNNNCDCYCILTIIINFHPLSLVVSCAGDPCGLSETCFDIPGDFICCPPGMNILAAEAQITLLA